MINLTTSNPIVRADGTVEREFLEWTLEVAKWIPVLGDGSPEGVVEAPLYTLYIDRTGTTGSIEYRKMQSSIAGDRKQGWVAV